jgi:hypothetical protein
MFQNVNKKIDCQALELKFTQSSLPDFASSWILFAIAACEFRIEFSQTILEQVYIQLIENKKIKKQYGKLILL